MISCYQRMYAFIYCEGFVWNLQDFGCVKKAVGCEGFVWNSPDFGCVKKAVGCVLFGIHQTLAMLKKLWVVKVLFGIHQTLALLKRLWFVKVLFKIHQTLALLKRLWLVRQTWQPLFRLFVQNIICDISIGWNCMCSNWQPSTNCCFDFGLKAYYNQQVSDCKIILLQTQLFLMILDIYFIFWYWNTFMGQLCFSKPFLIMIHFTECF